MDAGPLQHDEIDVGEPVPVRCLKNGLWLSREKDLPFAILMAPARRFGLCSGVQVEIAVPLGERGAQFSQELFHRLELQVSQGRTYPLSPGKPTGGFGDTACGLPGCARRDGTAWNSTPLSIGVLRKSKQPATGC